MSKRTDLWENSKEIAMLALGHFIEEGQEFDGQSMLVLASEADPVGKELSRQIVNLIEESDDISALVVSSQEQTTVMILPTWIVCEIMRPVNPEYTEIMEEDPPKGAMWTLVIAAKGMTLLQVPFEPIRPQGSA